MVLMNLVDNGFVGTVEESESGTNGESSTGIYTHTHTHTHTIMCKTKSQWEVAK